MDTDPQITGRLVEAFAAAKQRTGLTQADLARAAHVTPGAVSLWMKGGTVNLRPQHLFAVADLLSVEARWLATGDGPRERVTLPAADRRLLSDLARLTEPQRQTVQTLVHQIAEERGEYTP